VIHAPEVLQHALRRAVVGHLPAFVEQQGLVEHLEQARTGLMDGGDDDLVAREAADDLQHMLAVLRGQARGRFIEQIHVRDADHVEAGVEPLALAAAEKLLLRRAGETLAQIGQAEFRQLRIHALAPLFRLQDADSERPRKNRGFPAPSAAGQRRPPAGCRRYRA
jgi:hypothetical protein